jgi:hypothetical protein
VPQLICLCLIPTRPSKKVIFLVDVETGKCNKHEPSSKLLNRGKYKKNMPCQCYTVLGKQSAKHRATKIINKYQTSSNKLHGSYFTRKVNRSQTQHFALHTLSSIPLALHTQTFCETCKIFSPLVTGYKAHKYRYFILNPPNMP